MRIDPAYNLAHVPKRETLRVKNDSYIKGSRVSISTNRTQTHKYTNTQIHKYTNIYIYIYIHTHTHTHTHTHKHTHIRRYCNAGMVCA